MPALPGERELLDLLDRGEGLPHPERGLLLAGADDPGTEAATLAAGARDAAVLGLRRFLLGDVVEAVDTCPGCAATVGIEIDLRELGSPAAPPAVIEFRAGGHDIACRVPTAADLVDAARAPDVGAARAALLEATILDARLAGRRVATSALPADVVAAVGDRLLEADPLAEITLAVTCDDCGEAWLTQLDPVDFVWRELRTWSRHLIAEVHVLASAYGWTESDVLALPAWRRRAYRELVGHG